MSDLAQDAKRGASWQAFSQLIRPGWEFFVGLVLARILTPRDFGVVAMGMIVYSLASAVSSLGVGNVIIQKEELTMADLATSQSIATLMGGGLFAILCCASGLVGHFFKEPAAGAVLIVFGLNFVINSFGMIASGLLTRRLAFKRLALIEIGASLHYGVGCLLFAYFGFGLWSLVYSPVLSALFSAVCECLAASYLPRFGWHRAAARHIWGFGGTLTLGSIINYVARNVDYFVVGRVLGSSQLGLYKRAYDFAVIPKEKVGDVLVRVLFPFLCKIRDNRGWVRSSFLKTTKLIAILCLPVLVLFIFVGANLVAVLYGRQWLGAVTSFRIISVGGIFYSLSIPFGAVVIAYGRVNTHLRLQLVCSSLSVAGASLGSWWGIEGVAAGIALALILSFLISIRVCQSIIALTLADYLLNLKIPVLLCLGFLAMLTVADQMVACSPAFRVALDGSLLLASYVLVATCCRDPLVEELKEMVKAKLVGVKAVVAAMGGL